MFRSLTVAALAAAVVFTSRVPVPSAHPDKRHATAWVQRPHGLKGQDGPSSLPPGAKFAVLEGDPTKALPFVFRVKGPDGYKIPPHTHPKPERVSELPRNSVRALTSTRWSDRACVRHLARYRA